MHTAPGLSAMQFRRRQLTRHVAPPSTHNNLSMPTSRAAGLTLCNPSQESRALSLRFRWQFCAAIGRCRSLPSLLCILPLPRPGRKPRPTTAQGSGVRGSRGVERPDGKSSEEGFPTPDKHMARRRGKNNATGCGVSQPERWRNTWQSSRISLSSVALRQRGVEALEWTHRPRAKPRHHVSRLTAQTEHSLQHSILTCYAWAGVFPLSHRRRQNFSFHMAWPGLAWPLK